VRRVVLLAGPSGSGKTRLAGASGLPVLALDDFYRDGDDPQMPLQQELGIVDWDDPRSWDAARAVHTLVEICRHGYADVPVYDIAHDRSTDMRRFDVGGSSVFVAEGLFAGSIVKACRERDILADAIVLRRSPWMNFVRRLVRDVSERRKPVLTLLRRGWTLMRSERALLRRQVELGCRPCDARQLRKAFAEITADAGRPLT
jgi:uridine kinase